ncbi:hypothetical protein D3C76_27000 [compost metagenome]
MNDLIDFVRLLRALLSELANLGSYYGKTSPMFPGSCGFNRCIKRKQIGLGGNLMNGTCNIADAVGAILKLNGDGRDFLDLLFILAADLDQTLDDLIAGMEDFYDFFSSLSNRLRMIVHRCEFLAEPVELIDNLFSIIRLKLHGLGNSH